MDRRNWPWRKKSTEKISGSNESVDSPQAHFTGSLDDQDIPADHTGAFVEDETVHWQQSEEKLQQLKERLSVALLDASAKDELVKQHAKVAEEAVSGWEKAEAEAMVFKQKLESVMQQKLATEDRVSHLDGALKESMQQLRNVREEQEEKIHSAIDKTSRKWESVRAELEEKLLDMEQKSLDRDTENKAMSKLLEERAATISEISKARSRAEADLNVLRARLESMEREHCTLRCEFNLSKKDLETKNEEKLISRKSTQAATRQHLEDLKKISNLEGECQRLRGLVRKKFSVSGALVPVKAGMESLKDKSDSSKKKFGKSATSSGSKREETGLTKPQEETQSGAKDIDALLDRLTAMEDEMRRLKELLARRDCELQHARLMCARTASKLSHVEEQLENLSHDQGSQKVVGISALDKHIEAARSFTLSCEPSLASVSEDGNDDCSDAWASALITELSSFKNEKGSSPQDSGLHMPKLQPGYTVETDSSILSESNEVAKSQEQKVSRRVTDLYVAQHLYEQLSHKLRLVEREFADLETQNAATQSSLETLQAQFDAILQAQDDGKNVDAILDQVREGMGIPHCVKKALEKTSSGCSVTDSKPFAAKSDLTSTVCMLVKIVEGLGFTVSEFPALSYKKVQQDSKDLLQNEHEWSSHSLFWKCNDFNAKIKAFSAGSSVFLQGGANIVQFLGDLASILGDLVRTRVLEINIPSYTTAKSFSGDTVSSSRLESNQIGAYSPKSATSESDVFEAATRVSPQAENSIQTVQHELAKMEEEMRKVHGEKLALETHLRMEFERFQGLDIEVSQLRGEKIELEHLVEMIKEELDQSKFKLQQAEQVESNLRQELASALSSMQLMDEQLHNLSVTEAEAKSQLKLIETEQTQLQDRIRVLERGCADKSEEIAGLELKCQQLMEKLTREPMIVCSKCNSASNNGENNSKEQEIAAKLAECQQTILLLGKQLKAFTSPKERFNQSYDSLNDHLMSPKETPRQFVFSPDLSEFHADKTYQTKSSLEANSGSATYRKNRRRGHTKKEMSWEPHWGSNASDTLDSELLSLTKSGRPLQELFGDKTPAHEHYIQAVEQLTSSSDEEFAIPKTVEPVNVVKSAMRPPLHRKKDPKMYTGLEMSKSVDDTSSEKHNSTLSRLFSRAKNP